MANHSRYLTAMFMKQKQAKEGQNSDEVICQLSDRCGQELPESQFIYVLNLLSSLLDPSIQSKDQKFKMLFEKMICTLESIAKGNSTIKDEAIFLAAILPLSSSKLMDYYNKNKLHNRVQGSFEMFRVLSYTNREAALMFIKEHTKEKSSLIKQDIGTIMSLIQNIKYQGKDDDIFHIELRLKGIELTQDNRHTNIQNLQESLKEYTTEGLEELCNVYSNFKGEKYKLLVSNVQFIIGTRQSSNMSVIGNPLNASTPPGNRLHCNTLGSNSSGVGTLGASQLSLEDEEGSNIQSYAAPLDEIVLQDDDMDEIYIYFGDAKGEGDCFFDSFRQSLEEQKGVKVTVRELREKCKEFVENIPIEMKDLLTPGVPKEGWPEDYRFLHGCIGRKLTEREGKDEKIKDFHDYTNYIIHPEKEVWGDSDIEGIILCKAYRVKIHLIEPNAHASADDASFSEEQFLHQMIDNKKINPITDCKSINYKDLDTLHISNESSHFLPVFVRKKSELISTDCSLKDDKQLTEWSGDSSTFNGDTQSIEENRGSDASSRRHWDLSKQQHTYDRSIVSVNMASGNKSAKTGGVWSKALADARSGKSFEPGMIIQVKGTRTDQLRQQYNLGVQAQEHLLSNLEAEEQHFLSNLDMGIYVEQEQQLLLKNHLPFQQVSKEMHLMEQKQ